MTLRPNFKRGPAAGPKDANNDLGRGFNLPVVETYYV
jgi:hypothetical protein